MKIYLSILLGLWLLSAGCEKLDDLSSSSAALNFKDSGDISFSYSYTATVDRRDFFLDYSQMNLVAGKLKSCDVYVDVDIKAPWDLQFKLPVSGGISNRFLIAIPMSYPNKSFVNIGCFDYKSNYIWGKWQSISLDTYVKDVISSSGEQEGREAIFSEFPEAAEGLKSQEVKSSLINLSGLPKSVSNMRDLEIVVSGQGLLAYKYLLGAIDIECMGIEQQPEYQPETAISIGVSEQANLPDGKIKLCVLGKDSADGWESQDNMTVAEWEKDTTAPIAKAQLLGVPDGYSNQLEYAIEVLADDGSLYEEPLVHYVWKYNKLDAQCDSDVGFSEPQPIGKVINFTLDAPFEGVIELCVRGQDSAGNLQSADSMYTSAWTIDLTSPNFSFALNYDATADYYINTAEQQQDLPAYSIADGETKFYTAYLPSTVDCDQSKAYERNTIPFLSELPALDGEYIVCALISDSAGNQQYLRAPNILKDTLLTVTSLPLSAAASDGWVNAEELNGGAVLASDAQGAGFDSSVYAVALLSAGCETVTYTDDSGVLPVANSTVLMTNNAEYKVCVRVDDLAGNGPLYVASESFRLDGSQGPGITEVSANSQDSFYVPGDTIFLNMSFNEDITVSGILQLRLAVGGADRSAFYTGGSGGSSLTFEYQVQIGDSAEVLEYAGRNALSGGQITDMAGNPGSLLLHEVAGVGSLGYNNKIMVGEDNHFTTVWQTTAANESISLPLIDAGVHLFYVDWGDGGAHSHVASHADSDATHTYANPGSYIIKIMGNLGGWSFADNSLSSNIIRIDKWGNFSFIGDGKHFYGCDSLEIVANDIPSFSGVSSLKASFIGTSALNDIPNISSWDISEVTDLSYIFAHSSFNGDIGSWNTVNATTISYFMWNNIAFNQDISSWNTEKVTDASAAFFGATSFNQDIGSWNTALVLDMSQMFRNASQFNQDIGSWDTALVLDMSQMFRNASQFNQDISAWQTERVTSMEMMFNGASSFDQNLAGWNIELVASLADVFTGSALSIDNYSNILMGWGKQNLQSGVSFGAAESKYHPGPPAIARYKMMAANWVVEDAGRVKDECAAGFVRVPGDPDYGTTDFCIMKFEAQKSSALLPESNFSGEPWVNISQVEAKTKCTALGHGFTLVSNAHWMTVAANAASVSANWKFNEVGGADSYLSIGNSGRSTEVKLLAPPDETQPCLGTIYSGACSLSNWNKMRRTYVLSNGEVIWDLVGNIAEQTSYYADSDKIGSGISWQEYPSLEDDSAQMSLSYLIPTNSIKSFWNDTWGKDQQIGQLKTGWSANVGAVRRSGISVHDDEAGLFMANMSFDEEEVGEFTGFRCIQQLSDRDSVAMALKPRNTSIDISWSVSASLEYLLVKGPADVFPSLIPKDGTSYTEGFYGADTVVYVGAGASVSDADLASGSLYHYRLYAFDNNRDYNLLAADKERPMVCPGDYVLVPGDEDFGTEDFCIMKYEAKNEAGIAVSKIADVPWVEISQNSVITECTALGLKYQLLSNSQWMSVVSNLASNAGNWCSSDGSFCGSAGQIIEQNNVANNAWVLNRGHSDNNPALACPADKVSVEGNCTTESTADFSQKRTHMLLNGEEIWDLSGNVWDRTMYFNSVDKPLSISIEEYVEYTDSRFSELGTTPKSYLVPTSAVKNYWSDTWDGSQNIGSFKNGLLGEGGAMLRGGASEWASSGLFTANLTEEQGDRHTNVGFRCVVGEVW